MDKRYVPSRLQTQAAGFFFGRLKSWYTVPVHLIIPHGIAVLAALVAGIALYRVDAAILDLLNDTHMVGKSVLSAFIIPVKKDNVTGRGS